MIHISYLLLLRLLVGWLLRDDILILTSSGLIYFSLNGYSTEETRLIIADNINLRSHEHHIISLFIHVISAWLSVDNYDINHIYYYHVNRYHPYLLILRSLSLIYTSYLCIYQTTNTSSWGHINPLKDGEKIRLNISKCNKASSIPPSPKADNASTSHHSNSGSSRGSSGSSKAQVLLRPPPAAGSIVHFQSTTSNIISDTYNTQQKLSQSSTTMITSDSSAVVIDGEEDWSDFTSSWIRIHYDTI